MLATASPETRKQGDFKLSYDWDNAAGDLAGNRFSVEWLQPVHTDYKGYQLDRDGALSATWSVAF